MSAPHRAASDSLGSRVAAEALAGTIRRYWSKRGFKAEVWVDEAGYVESHHYVVRSDIVNGQPTATSRKKPGPAPQT